MGPFGGGGKLAAGDGIYDTGTADKLVDGDGELVPGDLAFVAVVIDAGGEDGISKDMEDGGSQVGGIGRRAQLVVDDIDGGAFFHEPDHGLYEVVAEFGIDPGGADDDGGAGVVLHGFFFTGQLGGAIGIDGAGGVVLF